MAELAVAGSVVGLISLGIQVTQSLSKFYTSYKDLDSDLTHMTEKLESLQAIFECLETTLSGREFQADERSLIENIESSIENCNELIEELQKECQILTKSSTHGVKAAFKVAGRLAKYPFRQSTLQKLDEVISEIRANVSAALDVLQLKDKARIQDDIGEMKAVLELVRSDQISLKIRGWLKAPDATINHNAACVKRHPGTGLWLVKGSGFSNWLADEKSFLWLKGFAGSGKSVLCSTAIQFALRHRRSDPGIGIAFFYFTFNDQSKQDESAMLRALLLQLCGQLKNDHADLTQLHKSYQGGMPPSLVLIEYLRRVIQKFRNVYILLDALDECPRNGPRELVLDNIEAMRNWDIPGLHIFVTSRDESDIRDSVGLSTQQEVSMQGAGLDQDISAFISNRLSTDRKLRKWIPYRDKIEDILAKRAQGVFRWVECQFNSFQSSPCNEYYLNRLLNSMPRSLDDTYERMLCNIDDNVFEDAQRILSLLCFAQRPLTVGELSDGVAVEVKRSAGLNRERRLRHYDDIQQICPGFIDVGHTTRSRLMHDREPYFHEDTALIPTVRIAHFSVQEYLESGRIRHPKAKRFSLTSSSTHAEIAQICLIYLLEPAFSSPTLDESTLEEYQMAHYAARWWVYHYKETQCCHSEIVGLILKLFQRRDSFSNWVRLYNFDTKSHKPSLELEWIPVPIYFASLLGLGQVAHCLINAEKQMDLLTSTSLMVHNAMVLDQINAYGGRLYTPLTAASSNCHHRSVQLLLDYGAEVNAIGDGTGYYDTALIVASYRGSEEVVRQLLNNGAEVNLKVEKSHYGTALIAASYRGSEEVVRQLLNNGAEVNLKVEKSHYGTALIAASYRGSEEVVRQLLNNGAEVNLKVEGSTALSTALFCENGEVVKLLLDEGAEVNVHGSDTESYDTPLIVASGVGDEDVVRILLEKGADINVQGRYTAAEWQTDEEAQGTSLWVAAAFGHEDVVRILLEKGADINVQGRYTAAEWQTDEEAQGTSLWVAAAFGHEDVVRILLEKGADTNALGKLWRHDDVGEKIEEVDGTALELASRNGHEKVVELLKAVDGEVDGN